MFNRRPREPEPVETPLVLAFLDGEGALFVHMDPEEIPDARAAGLVLADIAQNMAMMLHETGRAETPAAALQALRAEMDADLDDPTDRPHGWVE
jgi:hypothetical protein